MTSGKRLRAISGFGNKGPACFLLEIAGRRLILDLGRGPDGDRLPDLCDIGPVDAVLFSHGHVDHVGGLHMAAILGDPPLFAPGPTIALAQDPALRAATPYEALDTVLGLPFASGPCGHAPGASWMRIGGEAGLLYTGDISAESALWRWTAPPQAGALVFDASYGAADEPLAEQQGAMLAMADRPLLLPAPAGGRGLEMAHAFLAAGHAVALCPAHRAVAATMAATEGAAGWLAPGAAEGVQDLLARTTPLAEDSPATGVMIAAGPNAERGLAAMLAPRFLLEGSARVVFTGHLAEGTPSVDWVASGRAQFLRWNVHPRLTEIRHLLAAVQPGVAMPAFCSAVARAALQEALGGRPLADLPEIMW